MQEENKQEEAKQESKPDETGGFHIEGHVKIFDPESDEVIRNIRG